MAVRKHVSDTVEINCEGQAWRVDDERPDGVCARRTAAIPVLQFRSLIPHMMRIPVAAAACLAAVVSFCGHVQAEENGLTHIKPLFSSDKDGSKIRTRDAAKSGKGPYGQLISKYAAQYGVPVSLAQAVVKIESNFNPKARGSAGEVGLMQIKPATARSMGYSGSTKGLYDPETNIRFGMKYLAAAHQLGGGETCGTILRYNAGHGAKRMNPVSKRYCGKVQALLD